MMLLLIACCLFVVPFALAADPMSTAEKQLLVDLHNMLRAQEGAADMQMMVWDEYIESMAADWADGCSFAHGQPGRDKDTMPYDSVGQNLRVSARTTLNLTQGIHSWYNEKEHYNFDTRYCSKTPCGHYTQLVWSTSYALGCSWKYCSTLADAPFSSGVLLVCNYGPGGNYPTYPYIKGVPCAKCATGHSWCHKKLCNRDCTESSDTCECKLNCGVCGGEDSPQCTCKCANGWTGTDCKSECKELDETCTDGGWTASWCSKKSYVFDSCPILCGVCKPADKSCDGINKPKDPCLLWICQHGGTKKVSGDECVCDCPIGWKGNRCEVATTFVKIGGLLRVAAPASDWPPVWNYMQPKIADAINQYCYDHVKDCCPDAILTVSVDNLDFTTPEKVEISIGYPIEVQSGAYPITEAIVYSTGSIGNDLCTSAQPSRRKRRGVSIDSTLPPSVIVAAIKNHQARISKGLSACCGATLISVADVDKSTFANMAPSKSYKHNVKRKEKENRL